MAGIRVCVLGPAKLEVDGAPVRLTPLTLRLLVRLVAAAGEPLSVAALRHDVWGVQDPPRLAQRGRNEVQKRVVELRRAFDPLGTGAGTRVLATEQLFTGRAPESAYRLVLEPSQLDCAEFSELVYQALREPPVPAADKLARAVALWKGAPLSEAGDASYAAALTRRLVGLYETARRELVTLHAELGRLDLALSVAQRIAEEGTDDPSIASTLHTLRERMRESRGGEILSRDFPALRTSVAVVRGDLFEQHDSHLVIGFTDTFDTTTLQNFVISSGSVQGQLVERLFGGRPEALEALLRRGLRQASPAALESRSAKPRGKRVRYPIGTVAALPVNGRRIFATAYSRLGNDLVARSSPSLLAQSLEKLWESVALHGQYRPVAVPLVGSGLARIMELSREQLAALIVKSFISACTKHTAVASQLRLVLRPSDLEKMQMSDLARFIEAFDDDGAPPDDVRL
jgi:DNA-binding SARP family transcriptional activator